MKTRCLEAYDWPSRADERRRAFHEEVIDVEYRVIDTRRRPPPIGFGSALLIVSVLAIVLLRFMWPALLMGAVMLGVTTPAEMAAAVIGLTILAAAALHAKLSGRPF
jgi:hypothetical protein